MEDKEDIKKQQSSDSEQNSDNKPVADAAKASTNEVDDKSSVETESPTSDNAKDTPKIDKVAELEAKCEKLHNDYLYLYSEFETYKRRAFKEKSDSINSTRENVLANMLPLVDDVERAIAAVNDATDIKNLKDGIQLIHDKFISYLNKNEVKEIETKDKPFDTDFHEAIAVLPVEEAKKNLIVDCTQKGYMIKDKVLRHAKVVVGKFDK